MRKDENDTAQLVLLDHGLYDSLKPSDRRNLCHLYKAIILKDEDNMRNFSQELGVQGQWKAVEWGVIGKEAISQELKERKAKYMYFLMLT